MRLKFFGIPALGIAVVIAVYWLTRPGTAAVVQFVPSTSQSGLPNYTPSNASFKVTPPVLAPSPGLILLPARAANDYTTYNMPLLTPPVGKSTPGGACGCGGRGGACGCGCGAPKGTAPFPDGSGEAFMSVPTLAERGVVNPGTGPNNGWWNF